MSLAEACAKAQNGRPSDGQADQSSATQVPFNVSPGGHRFTGCEQFAKNTELKRIAHF